MASGRRNHGGEPPISAVEPRINERIRVPRVRLIAEDGEQLGIFNTPDAQRIADDANLDLVEVAPQADPPVCRIMDYSKWKYEEALKAKKARKHQTTIQVKEIKFRPKIDKHDYETKKKHVTRFLEANSKVKVTIMFRGREMVHAERGLAILERLAADLGTSAVIENQPKIEGRNMFMLIAPVKKDPKVLKEEAAAAAAAAAEAEAATAAFVAGETSEAPVEDAPVAKAMAAAVVKAKAKAPAVAKAKAPEEPAAEAEVTDRAAEVEAPVAKAPAKAPAKAKAAKAVEAKVAEPDAEVTTTEAEVPVAE